LIPWTCGLENAISESTVIESINQTLKGQVNLERHGTRTLAGLFTRVAQRLLAMAAKI
jgi:hypothetical protein